MQKEVFLAIFIGFIIGLAITFGVWQANQVIKTANSPTPGVTSEPTISEVSQPKLNLSSPANDFLSKEKKVSLAGNYAPNSFISVIFETGEKIVETDETGAFETEIDLILGENQIEVQGLTKEGSSEKQTLTIVYSTAEI